MKRFVIMLEISHYLKSGATIITAYGYCEKHGIEAYVEICIRNFIY